MQQAVIPSVNCRIQRIIKFLKANGTPGISSGAGLSEHLAIIMGLNIEFVASYTADSAKVSLTDILCVPN